MSARGFSAYQMVFGSNPADLFGWENEGEVLMFAQDSPVAGQFVQRWKLRVRAQGATLKEVANSEPRRLLERKKSFNCADIAVGALFSLTQPRVERALCDGEALRRSAILTRPGPRYLLKVSPLKWLGIARESD